MACSQCGNSLYSCHLEAGPGIAIQGDGSLSNPYEIINTGDATGSVTCDQVEACLASSGFVEATGTAANGDILVWNSTSGAWVRSQNYLHNQVGGGLTNVVTSSDNATVELDIVPGSSQTADAFRVRPGAGSNPSFQVTAAGYARARSLAAGDVPFAVYGASGQTADLQDWVNGSGSKVAWMQPDGIGVAPNWGPAPVIVAPTAPTTNPAGGPLLTGTVWIDSSGAAA
jgi:hypothetical protein